MFPNLHWHGRHCSGKPFHEHSAFSQKHASYDQDKICSFWRRSSQPVLDNQISPVLSQSTGFFSHIGEPSLWELGVLESVKGEPNDMLLTYKGVENATKEIRQVAASRTPRKDHCLQSWNLQHRDYSFVLTSCRMTMAQGIFATGKKTGRNILKDRSCKAESPPRYLKALPILSLPGLIHD